MKLDYKDLVAASNAMVCALVEGAFEMGIDTRLLFHRMANAFQRDAGKLLEDIKYEGKGYSENFEDVSSIQEGIEMFVKAMPVLGFSQDSEILELTDDKLKVKFDYCMFQPSTLLTRRSMEKKGVDHVEDHPPPCLLMAMLEGLIHLKFDNNLHIDKIEEIAEENASIIHATIE